MGNLKAVYLHEESFLKSVDIEVLRAREKFPNQETEVDIHGWLAILVEEVGEVARELNEFMLDPDKYSGHNNMLTELVQVGAMACMMSNAVNVQWFAKRVSDRCPTCGSLEPDYHNVTGPTPDDPRQSYGMTGSCPDPWHDQQDVEAGGVSEESLSGESDPTRRGSEPPVARQVAAPASTPTDDFEVLTAFFDDMLELEPWLNLTDLRTALSNLQTRLEEAEVALAVYQDHYGCRFGHHKAGCTHAALASKEETE